MAVLGDVLAILAFIIGMVSWIWFIVVAAKEGVAWLIFVIFPCTNTIACIALSVKNWKACKIPMGLLILSIIVQVPATALQFKAGMDEALERPLEIDRTAVLENRDRDFSITVPASWRPTHHSDSSLTAENAERVTGLEARVIDSDKLQVAGLDGVLDERLQQFEFEATEVPKRSDGMVGGVMGRRIEVSGGYNGAFVIGGAAEHNGFTYVVLVRGWGIYEDEDRPLFETIFASFKIAGTAPIEGDIDVDIPIGNSDGPDSMSPRPTTTTPKEKVPTEEELLETIQTVEGSARLQALQQWRLHDLDRKIGARKRMLQAWGGSFSSDAQRMLLRSMQENPLQRGEAIECLKLGLPSTFFVPIVKRLQGDPEVDPDAFAAALEKAPPEQEQLVEETLIQIGRPRPGAIGRLLERRGPDWGLSTEGRELISSVAGKSELDELKPLLESDSPGLRALGCDLLARSSDEKAALEQLKGLLKDEVPEVRRRTAAAMQGIGNPRAAMYLALALVREKDDQVKAALDQAIAGLPREKAVAYLSKLTASKKAGLRMAGVVGLRSIKSAQVIPLLAKLIREEPEKSVLMAALEGLRAMSSQSDLRKQMNIAVRDLEAVARESKDKEARRLAGRIYYTVTGRVIR